MKNSFRSTQPFTKELVEAIELYDYDKDPNETINVAGEKEYSTVLKDMNENMVRFLESQVKKTAAMKIESR